MATVLSRARRLYIIFHGDFDGVAGAALLARWASERGISWEARFSPVRALPRVTREVVSKARGGGFGKPGVAFVDLAVQSLSDAILYATLLKGLPSAWFDHHPWPSGAADRLLAAGVEVYHSRDMVSAELVAKALGLRDAYSKRLVEMARADDTCEPRESEVDKWRVVLRHLREPEKAVKSLAEGEVWPEWAERLYTEVGERYWRRAEEVAGRLRVLEVDGFRIAVVPMEPDVDVCSVQKVLWRRGWRPDECDVEVYVYPRAISLRSVKHDVSCIARSLGGGGHARAAGAPKPSRSMGDAQIARIVARALERCVKAREGSR